MLAHEIEQALGGLDTAKGSVNALDLPPNSETVIEITEYTIDVNKKNGSKTNGLLFAAINGTVVSCSSPALPVGANARVAFFGLNSPVNQGSLARENQEGLRNLTAAALGRDPSQPPAPGHTWQGLCAKIAAGNQAVIVGKRVRVVAGAANGQGYTKKQFFPVG